MSLTTNYKQEVKYVSMNELNIGDDILLVPHEEYPEFERYYHSYKIINVDTKTNRVILLHNHRYGLIVKNLYDKVYVLNSYVKLEVEQSA